MRDAQARTTPTEDSGTTVRERPSWKQMEEATYDAIYSAEREFASERIRKGLLDESEDAFLALLHRFSPRARVLEIGAGSGVHSRAAVRAGAAKVVGIDISAEAVELARRAAVRDGITGEGAFGSRLSFEVADIDALPYPDNAFDLVLDHEVFSSIDIATSMHSLHRVLAPGGRIVGIECFAHNPIFAFNRWINVRRGRRTPWAASHIFSRQDLHRLRELFEVESLSYHHLLTVLPGGIIHAVAPESAVTRAAIGALRSLDRMLLGSTLFAPLAFKVVFSLRTKKIG